LGADVFSFLMADRKMDGGYTGYLYILFYTYIYIYIYISYILGLLSCGNIERGGGESTVTPEPVYPREYSELSNPSPAYRGHSFKEFGLSRLS
jgi:hypothetical protein